MLILDKDRQRTGYRLGDALKLLRYHALSDNPDRQHIASRRGKHVAAVATAWNLAMII